MNPEKGNSQTERLNVANVYLSIWEARKEIGILAGVFVLLTFVWIAVSQPLYMATAVFAPAPTNQSTSSGLGGLASAAKLVGIAGLGSMGQNNQFTQFQALITSRALAGVLAKRPGVLKTIFESRWDEQAHTWKHQTGFFATVKEGLKSLAGLPPSRDPDAEQLQFYLQKRLNQNLSEQTGLLTLTFEFDDPQFAEYLLAAVHRDADNILRYNARSRSRARIAYLQQTLPMVTMVEQRQVLIDLLNQEEQTHMMIASDPNFAADPVDPPNVSMRPVWPNPPLMFGLALVAAIFSGIVWHYFLGALAMGRFGELMGRLRLRPKKRRIRRAPVEVRTEQS